MDMPCVFCGIIEGAFKSEKVYEDDGIIAIKDISPVSPIHILIMPKKHSKNICEADSAVIADIMSKIPLIAKKAGVDENGFRLVINTGADGGQTVDHLHIHLLGGREMQWPPG